MHYLKHVYGNWCGRLLVRLCVIIVNRLLIVFFVRIVVFVSLILFFHGVHRVFFYLFQAGMYNRIVYMLRHKQGGSMLRLLDPINCTVSQLGGSRNERIRFETFATVGMPFPVPKEVSQ